jgi:hypothetical protein
VLNGLYRGKYVGHTSSLSFQEGETRTSYISPFIKGGGGVTGGGFVIIKGVAA